MLSLENIDKIDSKKMHVAYEKWPEIAKQSYEKVEEELQLKNIDHFIFAGMGGSGTIGDVMNSILSKEAFHVNIIKGYTLPNTVNSNTLIVITSVSGNTHETLSILEQAYNSDATVIVFSSGGKMEKICRDREIIFRKITMEHSPRASFVKFLFSILNILKNIIPITNKDVLDAISSLEKTRDVISTNNLNSKNISLNIAKCINKTPVIYYPRGLDSVATRFKNSLQENSKIHVINEELLETCHNGIVSWNEKNTFQPILIRGKDDHEKTKERWEIIKEFFDDKQIKYLEINSINGNILSKIVNMIYVTDFASVYHSILNNIDPSPVASIDYVKKRL